MYKYKEQSYLFRSLVWGPIWPQRYDIAWEVLTDYVNIGAGIIYFMWCVHSLTQSDLIELGSGGGGGGKGARVPSGERASVNK